MEEIEREKKKIRERNWTRKKVNLFHRCFFRHQTFYPEMKEKTEDLREEEVGNGDENGGENEVVLKEGEKDDEDSIGDGWADWEDEKMMKMEKKDEVVFREEEGDDEDGV